MNINIKLISDTHNEHSQITDTECDILIHAGDATTKGTYSEGLAFLQWFVKQPAKYKILVPGNHDRRLKTHPDLISLAKEYGIITLVDEGVTINGVKFYGNHHTFSVKNGKYSLPDDERRQCFSRIPDDLDVLITHMPPSTVLSSNEAGEDCGCDELLKKVLEVKPKYHVFGHIHEHGGKELSFSNIKFMNVSCMNRGYQIVRHCTELQIKTPSPTKE